jgi:predicted O-methyltransferase YrrM
MPADLERVRRIRRTRAHLSRYGPDRVRREGDFERVSLPVVDADALREVLVVEQARVVIEIGLAYGSSALAITEAIVSQGTDDARHFIVDAFQDHFHDAGWRALMAAGLADVSSLVRERSQLALPKLVVDGFVADAAFVDGSHLFHNVFVDLAFLRELVRPGGLVILDDCDWPSVATAARYFEINAGWEPVPFAHNTRLRAYRLPDPRPASRFEDFEPFGLDTDD